MLELADGEDFVDFDRRTAPVPGRSALSISWTLASIVGLDSYTFYDALQVGSTLYTVMVGPLLPQGTGAME
jgi:hypothetical protein